MPRRTAEEKLYERQLEEEMLSNIYLPFAKLEFESDDWSNDWLSVGMTSAQGWRAHQEDAHVCELEFDQNSALFAVFDGHNGPEVARYAAEKLPQHIKLRQSNKTDYVQVFEKSFMEFDESLLEEKTNERLHSIRRQYELENGPIRRHRISNVMAATTGCTAVVALLKRNGQFYVSNIGDSRCVLCVKGKPIPLSNDHKPTDEPELRRIKKAGFEVINGRINHGLNLSRAFGDHFMKNNLTLTAEQQAVTAFPEVIYSESKVKPGDFMVLACDGIWNCLSNKELCSFVRKHIKRGTRLSTIGQELIRKCVSPVRPIDGRIGGDNMTCIIVKFKQELTL